MIITKIRDYEFMAEFKGQHAYGYTALEALMNLLFLILE